MLLNASKRLVIEFKWLLPIIALVAWLLLITKLGLATFRVCPYKLPSSQ